VVFGVVCLRRLQSPISEQNTPQAYAVKILLELCVEQVNLLEQIRLEVELHYNDSDKGLKAFDENVGKFLDIKLINFRQYNVEIEEAAWNLKNKKIKKSEHKKKVKIALDRFVCFFYFATQFWLVKRYQ
jgi:hypothetical protein